MDGVRLGRAIRTVRRRRGWRQADVAVRARVTQSTISRIEAGDIGRLMVSTLAAVADAVGVELSLVARYRGAELSRLLDERHARVVGQVAARLRSLGWEVIVEYTFSHFGERGSVDVLAWHPGHRALLIVEVKTAIADLQDLFATQDRKARLVPGLVAADRAWKALAIGTVLAMPEETTLRRRVAANRDVFDVALPAATRDVARWLECPTRPIRGIWFVPQPRGRRAAGTRAGRAGTPRARATGPERGASG